MLPDDGSFPAEGVCYCFVCATVGSMQLCMLTINDEVKGRLQSLRCSCLLHPIFLGSGTSTYLVMYNNIGLNDVSVLQTVLLHH